MEYRPRALITKELEPRPMLEDVTVVIPTLGRPILEESLSWIVAGSSWPGGLVVVDQGRSAQVAGWLAALSMLGIDTQYLPSEQRGRAAGVNRGLEAARTRFVAVTDDDCFVEADWLANMVRHLREHPYSIVTGRVEAAGEGVLMSVTSQARSVQRKPNLLFDHMSGGNMGTSVAVLSRIGLFDEDPRLRTSEDGEYAYRALRARVPIYYEPDVCVRHFGWRDPHQRSTQYREYALSHGGFYGKYLRRGDLFIALRALLHEARALRRWLRGLYTRDQDVAVHGRAYATYLIPGIISGIRQGRQP